MQLTGATPLAGTRSSAKRRSGRRPQLIWVFYGPEKERKGVTRRASALAQYADGLKRCGFRPLTARRDPACWSKFYRSVPFRYPRLFEELCLAYSWEQAVVGEVEFAANPRSGDLQALAAAVAYDCHLWDMLLPSGYLIFGRLSGGRYDPVAFDLHDRTSDDAAVVRIDHEEVLSFQRVGGVVRLAASFETLLKPILGSASRP